MNKLIWTSKFKKSAEKFFENNPDKIDLFKICIKQIEEDPFHPSLRTHKLKGKLHGLFSSSINFSFRVIFQFYRKEKHTIILLNIGDHNEVY